MNFLYAILVSVGICVAEAILEGVCAGRNVKAYFAAIKLPASSLPLGGWYAIGGVYYLVFGFLLYRMFRTESDSVLPSVTIALIVFMMTINGLWNIVFFRRKNFRLAYLVGNIAPIFDLKLLFLVLLVDSAAAWVMVPYLLYRIYAVWWGYALWKVNKTL